VRRSVCSSVSRPSRLQIAMPISTYTEILTRLLPIQSSTITPCLWPLPLGGTVKTTGKSKRTNRQMRLDPTFVEEATAQRRRSPTPSKQRVELARPRRPRQ
jgi:hypothetical protein